MKRLLFMLSAFCGIFGSDAVYAQAVPKAVLAEHFTNSYCSVCANRNPGFYQNLAQFPQVLHISYYASAPYPACPINQYNKPEADARTNYYGVYGSTPRLAIQGAAIPAGTNYSSASIFQSELGKTTSFDVRIGARQLSAITGEARVVILKMDTSSLDSVSVYAAIVEDTLAFAAQNGEQKHYDVFRRSVWGAQPIRVKSPVAVGDSVVLIQNFAIDAAWPLGRMRIIAVVQEKSGALIQAAKSGSIVVPATTAVVAMPPPALRIFPNPTSGTIRIDGLAGESGIAVVSDLQGRTLLRQPIENDPSVQVGSLAAGQYILRILVNGVESRFLFARR